MTRAAIYGRYSTDKQREASIEDQARVCRARAEREGWDVAIAHSDDGISGSVPVAQRPGGARLLADALAGRFDVLLLEGLDRLSRDLVEQEQIVRRLEHRGLRIVGVSDGYDSTHAGRKLHRGMRGLINEIYLDDLRAKVHRGLDGLVARQLFAGGMPYGYRSTIVGPADKPDGHRLVIDAARAAIVREIFARYAEGWSTQRIASELNRRRVPAPRGNTWAVSALYGSPKKGCGILNNPIYVGRYIWNRSQWVKDPDSGKRRRLERPEREWRKVELPELRIVADEIWTMVRARLSPTVRPPRGRPPRTMLAGLLKCGHCGGSVVAVSQYVYGCAARKDRGVHVCAGVRAPRLATERALLEHVRRDLLSDSAIEALRRYVYEALAARRAKHLQGSDTSRARLAQLEREIKHLVEAIATCGVSEALRTRLAAAEAERASVTAELATVPDATIPHLLPRLVDRYRKLLDDFPATLQRKPDAAREALRHLLGDCTVVETNEGVYAELGGVYSGILAALGTPGAPIRNRVAGDRFSDSNRVLIIRREAA